MAELIPLRRGEPIFDQRGFGTLRFNEYIEQLTSRVNTTSSETNEINTQLSSVQQTLSQLVELLEKKERVVNTTVNYTAQIGDIISCNNVSPIIITTPVNPIKDDIVPAIKRTNGSIRVEGPIDGETFKVINKKDYSMKLAYNGTMWIEI